eukprot:5820208-Alexandrium_andersonii.AAC.1
MSGGAPEDPPGLEPRGPSAKRSRSAGAALSTRATTTSPSASTAPAIAPTTFGPPGAVGSSR